MDRGEAPETLGFRPFSGPVVGLNCGQFDKLIGQIVIERVHCGRLKTVRTKRGFYLPHLKVGAEMGSRPLILKWGKSPPASLFSAFVHTMSHVH